MRQPVCTSTIETSPCAENTLNPIRKLVDQLVINPNPEKSLLKLSIGESNVFSINKTHKSLLEKNQNDVDSNFAF